MLFERETPTTCLEIREGFFDQASKSFDRLQESVLNKIPLFLLAQKRKGVSLPLPLTAWDDAAEALCKVNRKSPPSQ
ncbi:hypothetical protein CEXT_689341 [Caerostris extrusa]|uniref:Uncharacterized protein n=1 Tax=Caerostris extrusa TaxID=172846 RepID=A0AAV4RMX6_CAEEX|nr:hypothetical protein CEXT_689341 [Caerostris extrusa]